MRTLMLIALALSGVGAAAATAAAEETQADDPATWVEVAPDVSLEWEEGATVVEGDETELVRDARAGGAVVRTAACTIENRELFRRTIVIRGHFVLTPSGNTTLVCHAQIPGGVIRNPPSEALVVEDGVCEIPRFQFTESHLVLTPSFHLHLICHLHPSGQ